MVDSVVVEMCDLNSANESKQDGDPVQGDLDASLQQDLDICSFSPRCQQDQTVMLNLKGQAEDSRQTRFDLVCQKEDCWELVEALLAAGADPNAVNTSYLGRRPIHFASESANHRAIAILLRDERTEVNATDFWGRSALHCVAEHSCSTDREREGLQRCTKLLLERSGVQVDLRNGPMMRTALHLSAEAGNYTVLETLLRDGRCDVNSVDSVGSVALHLAAGQLSRKPDAKDRLQKCVKALLGSSDETRLDLNARDSTGMTALHYAAFQGDQEIILSLLRHGAYMYTNNADCVQRLNAIPVSTLQTFLDGCLSASTDSPQGSFHELIFNFTFLAPPEQNASHSASLPGYSPVKTDEACGDDSNQHYQPEMGALHYMSSSKELCNLLKHPIIESFLILKWYRVRTIFFLNLIFYMLFVLSLTSYILLVYSMRQKVTFDNSTMHEGEVEVFTPESEYEDTKMVRDMVWMFLTTTLLPYLVVRELTQMVLSFRKYICSAKNYWDWGLITTAVIILYTDWEQWGGRDHIAALSIFVLWIELALETGRVPRFSVQLEMLKKVSITFINFMTWYCLLLITFGLSFYILFGNRGRREDPSLFEDPGMSIFKILIMMAGEFEASTLPFNLVPVTSHIVFVVFMFLIAIVLFNLLNGLAVSDTKAIIDGAQLVSLMSLVSLISYIERSLLSLQVDLPCWRAKRGRFLFIYRMFSKCSRSFARYISVFPHYLPRNQIRVLPNKGCEVYSDYRNPLKTNWLNGEHKMSRSIVQAAMDITSDTRITSDMDHVRETLETLHRRVDAMEGTLSKILSILEKHERHDGAD